MIVKIHAVLGRSGVSYYAKRKTWFFTWTTVGEVSGSIAGDVKVVEFFSTVDELLKYLDLKYGTSLEVHHNYI